VRRYAKSRDSTGVTRLPAGRQPGHSSGVLMTVGRGCFSTIEGRGEIFYPRVWRVAVDMAVLGASRRFRVHSARDTNATGGDNQTVTTTVGGGASLTRLAMSTATRSTCRPVPRPSTVPPSRLGSTWRGGRAHASQPDPHAQEYSPRTPHVTADHGDEGRRDAPTPPPRSLPWSMHRISTGSTRRTILRNEDPREW
jgi:hypothetical protein